MANKYGFLNRIHHNGQDIFKGEFEIVGTALHGDIILKPLENRGENAPTHDILVKGRSGDWVSMGKAWTKKLKQAPFNEFFTLNIDAPMMAAPINLTSFPLDMKEQPEYWNADEDPIAYSIVWSRPRKSNAVGSTNQPIDDDIPF